MIELFFVACLAVSPQQCQERSMVFTDASVSQATCEIHAQNVLAHWIGGQPRWRIKRWRCGYAGQSQEA